MSPVPPSRTDAAPSVLVTLGWVGVVILCALVAIVILSLLGPVGGQ